MIVQTRNLGERFAIVCIHGESVSLGIHYPDGMAMASEEFLGHWPDRVEQFEEAAGQQCSCVDLG